eukprot:TRINITY_DN2189_c0_g1_i7.p1 TRINITY_DN2189_c0_g1~~TRINITY_DN2189_c0_g1_i7.p1  ORF type:complete len:165 (-),score=76.84 TRINITY_DN2189_c0_g1_i7:262-687(-)
MGSHLKMFLLIPLLPLISFCSGSPVAVLQTCSSLAPEFLKPILQEAQYMAMDMDVEMEMLVADMKMLMPGTEKLALSELWYRYQVGGDDTQGFCPNGNIQLVLHDENGDGRDEGARNDQGGPANDSEDERWGNEEGNHENV